MGKLLLLSVVIAMISIPILSARERSAARALKKTAFLIAVFDLFYLLVLRFVYSHVQ
jgi:hypothetical protein